MNPTLSFDMSTLRQHYLQGTLTPAQLVDSVLARIGDDPHKAWIQVLSREALLGHAARLAACDPASLPLYGIPFAIKDNIDLAGIATTAACPAFSSVPAQSATVVQRLIEAGAIPVGKTNLDQFATGLNGTRSPYGACHNSIDPDYISGGSSAGSAVSVALGQVSFSLGTDTAGSGRVPAAFNNLVGLKPTRGLLSTHGVLPACRSLDCVSIFALTAQDAALVFEHAAAPDDQDPYSRQESALPAFAARFRFGVPQTGQLAFFGNPDSEALFAAATARLQALGGEAVHIDFAPFLEAARLLYEGPWVAERYLAIRDFIEASPEALLPVTRQITEGGKTPSAADAFAAMYRLEGLRKQAEAALDQVDVLLTPTAGTIYRIEEMLANPVTLNSNLGYYTNFMNLFDLAAIAVPAGFAQNGLPFGISLCAPAHADRALLQLAQRWQAGDKVCVGAGKQTTLAVSPPVPQPQPDSIPIAVCGAHMSGLPLNRQLLERGAVLLRTTATAPVYRFYALAGGPPYRPGLVRVAEGGASVALEIWALPARHWGSFVAGIPAPLGIGTVELEDGSTVKGFICEPWLTGQAKDITHLGGWRPYLASI